MRVRKVLVDDRIAETLSPKNDCVSTRSRREERTFITSYDVQRLEFGMPKTFIDPIYSQFQQEKRMLKRCDSEI